MSLCRGPRRGLGRRRASGSGPGGVGGWFGISLEWKRRGGEGAVRTWPLWFEYGGWKWWRRKVKARKSRRGGPI